MTAVPKEPHPFDPNAQGGYNAPMAVLANEILQTRRAQKSREFVFLAVICVLAYLWYSAAHVIPPIYALVIDSTKKHVQIAQLATLDKSPELRDLVVQGELPDVITYAFTFNDPDSYQTGLKTNVDPFVLGGSIANSEIADHMKKRNAEALGTRIKVDLDSIIQHGSTDNQYIAGWTETVSSNGQVTDVRHVTAQITVAWYPRSVGNLVGMYITDFKVLSDLPQRVQTP